MEEKFVRVAKIGGKEVNYSACSSERNAYQDAEKSGFFKYLGKGTIYTINGTKQSGNRRLHFWASKEIQDELEATHKG